MVSAASVYLDKVLAFFQTHGQGCPDFTTDLIGTGLLDSLALAVFLTYLEHEFDVDIAASEVTPEHFGTIASTMRFLEEKLHGR